MVAKTINIPIPILNLTYDFENDWCNISTKDFSTHICIAQLNISPLHCGFTDKTEMSLVIA